jgi:hypothetical protein
LTGNITLSDIRVAAVLFPALAAGYVASYRFKNRVSQPIVRNAILVLSLLGAVGLIIRAIS